MNKENSTGFLRKMLFHSIKNEGIYLMKNGVKKYFLKDKNGSTKHIVILDKNR
jgi:hypothetical protein